MMAAFPPGSPPPSDVAGRCGSTSLIVSAAAATRPPSVSAYGWPTSLLQRPPPLARCNGQVVARRQPPRVYRGGQRCQRYYPAGVCFGSGVGGDLRYKASPVTTIARECHITYAKGVDAAGAINCQPYRRVSMEALRGGTAGAVLSRETNEAAALATIDPTDGREGQRAPSSRCTAGGNCHRAIPHLCGQSRIVPQADEGAIRNLHPGGNYAPATCALVTDLLPDPTVCASLTLGGRRSRHAVHVPSVAPRSVPIIRAGKVAH